MIFVVFAVQRSVLVAAFILVVGVVAAFPNGTQELSKESSSTTPPSSTSEVLSTKVPEEEERPASVEQVPPPAPLITESAKQGYRMPGLYALGTQPFYLQRDPVTGAVDFSVPSLSNNNHRYSSKIAQPTAGNEDHDDYDDVIALNNDESDPIDRKDTLGPNTANDIKIQHQDYQNENHKHSRPTKERFPLISSSYANTKVQGMGVTKSPPRRYSTISSGPSPTYYNIREKSTTESILDFWPQKSSTTLPPPVVHDTYDYYEESPVSEEEADIDATESEDMGSDEHPSSTTAPIEFSSTPTPYRTTSVAPVTHTKPSFTNERPDVFVRPYEEPFRPIYKVTDGVVDIPNENSPIRPRPPSIYDLPPSDENSPHVPFTPNRPPNSADSKRPLTVFSPPPLSDTYNQQQPNNGRPPPPQIPSIMQQPPKFEPPTKFAQNERIDESDGDSFTVRPPQIDSQGWKQATYTDAPQSSMSTNKVHFPQVDSEEIYATLSNQPSIKQQLPQGYEPQRPGDYRPQEPIKQRPDIPPHLRQQANGNNNFENGRPSTHFERPNHGQLVPGRHQFDPASIPDGNLRVPSNVPIQSRPPQPPRRSDTRPPSFITHYGNKNQQRFEGVRPKDHAQFVGNNPENLESPVILPQFRPNAKIPPNSAIGNFRVVSNANRRPPPAYFERLYPPPPPPPPVGRRVGSQVSTLQMMQHGSFPRPSAREDAPFSNSKPPVSTYEVRPAKYGQQQQGSEERPVFVVYANSGESQQQSDILVGTHGLHKPLPPSHLTEEEPVLSKKPPLQNIPIKADFPYALEKPAAEITKIPNINNEEIDKDDDDVNIIPNLQDYVPLGIKATTSMIRDTTPYKDEVTPKPTEHTRVVSILRPQNKNEFTVSAVMHTGNHPGGSSGTGSVMVVAPQHRNPVESSQSTSTTSHESYNFQAPFHPSANVAPSPGNGWSAVKGTTENSESLRPGTVIDRADLVDEMHMSTSHANSGNKFDIENFKPELIGGFKPIYSFTEENAPEKKQQQQTTEREEKKM